MKLQLLVSGRAKAFTLIELLVVISVISLLSSIIFSSVNASRVRARDTKRMQDVVQLRSALNLYAFANGGAYPAGDFWSSITTTGASPYEWSDFSAFLVPAHIGSLPIDPLNSGNFNYYYTSNFRTGMISGSNGNEGSCVGKRLIMIRALEGNGPFRRDCTPDAAFLASSYPKSVYILIE